MVRRRSTFTIFRSLRMRYRREVIEDLLASGAFAGIKDSSGDWPSFERLLALREKHPFQLMVGNDVIYRRARTGCGWDRFGSGGSGSGIIGGAGRAIVLKTKACGCARCQTA